MYIFAFLSLLLVGNLCSHIIHIRLLFTFSHFKTRSQFPRIIRRRLIIKICQGVKGMEWFWEITAATPHYRNFSTLFGLDGNEKDNICVWCGVCDDWFLELNETNKWSGVEWSSGVCNTYEEDLISSGSHSPPFEVTGVFHLIKHHQCSLPLKNKKPKTDQWEISCWLYLGYNYEPIFVLIYQNKYYSLIITS